MEEPKRRKKGLEADYQGATPEQVARAFVRHRPAAKKKQLRITVEREERLQHAVAE